MGKGLADELKREFAIEERWLPYEIHPDTPAGGVRWEDYFPGMDPASYFSGLNARGKRLGVVFNSQPLMANSRLSLEACEFARDKGAFEPFHDRLFRAYFTDCLNIGLKPVLLDVADAVGLDAGELDAALAAGIYAPVLEEARRAARALRVTAVPTFDVKGGGLVVGASAFELRAAVERAARR